jgi:hypothetical protein
MNPLIQKLDKYDIKEWKKLLEENLMKFKLLILIWMRK